MGVRTIGAERRAVVAQLGIGRRQWLGTVAFTGAPGLFQKLCAAPNSKFGGVTIGVIAPYAFQGMANDLDSIVNACVDLGISGVELQNAPVEAYAGAPQPQGGPAGSGPVGGPGGGGPGGGAGAGRGPGGRAGRAPLTPEQIEARRQAAQALTKFRLAAGMDKFKEVRGKFNGAGIEIYAYKFEYSLANLSD